MQAGKPAPIRSSRSRSFGRAMGAMGRAGQLTSDAELDRAAPPAWSRQVTGGGQGLYTQRQNRPSKAPRMVSVSSA